MSLALEPFETGAPAAVRHFWESRAIATSRQQASGHADHGERAGVTAGKNMDGFIDMFAALARANGMTHAQVYTQRAAVTLPGYYRATKNWDLLMFNGRRLLAAIELKSQVGPSFGNNFNNRAEEAIGTAHDFWTAFREGAYGVDQPRPFVGWVMLVEDTWASREPVQRVDAPHFDVRPEFRGTSYLERYEILCRRLMMENLYTCAAVITSSRDAGADGGYSHVSQATSLRTFATTFASYAAAEATRPTEE
ncbi:MAG: PaeR7I family type II restriction endonuclease [Propionibacteriaceae bacterium]|nr:PaeR7I family type II restriction endonuclease [Propionibacteriaceae bacterium]